jgi:hypothetical protein
MLLVTSLLAAATIADPGQVGAGEPNHALPQPRQRHTVYYDGPSVTVSPDPKSDKRFTVDAKDGASHSKVSHFAIYELKRASPTFRLELHMKEFPDSKTTQVRVQKSVADVTFDSFHAARDGAIDWVNDLNKVEKRVLSDDSNEEDDEDEEDAGDDDGDEDEEDEGDGGGGGGPAPRPRLAVDPQRISAAGSAAHSSCDTRGECRVSGVFRKGDTEETKELRSRRRSTLIDALKREHVSNLVCGIDNPVRLGVWFQTGDLKHPTPHTPPQPASLSSPFLFSPQPIIHRSSSAE